MIKKLITISVLSLGLAFVANAADKEGGDKKGKGAPDPAKRAAAIMKADSDGDGKVSAAEFSASKMAEGMNKRKDGSADAFFAKADADKDGSLTKEEVESIPARGKGDGKGKGKGKGDDKKES